MEMIIPSTCYQLDASEKTITLLTPYHGTTIEQIKSIREPLKNLDIYNSSTVNNPITVTGGVITYTHSAALVNSDKLQIVIDNVVDTSGLSPTDPPLITSSLVFAADDTLTTEKYTDPLTLPF